MNTKQATKNVKAALLAPQTRPFIVDAAVNYNKRRKKIITQWDIGKAAAIRCGSGIINFCEEMI